jgi:type II secretory pathway predicted ATPase ExeA
MNRILDFRHNSKTYKNEKELLVMISPVINNEFSKKLDLFRQSSNALLLVTGDSGVGKTIAAKGYVSKNANNKEVLYSVLATLPTIKNYGIELLNRLNIPFQRNMTTDQVVKKVFMSIKALGIKVVLIDDFQRLFECRKCYLEEFVLFLNILSENSGVKFILFGLPNNNNKLRGHRHEVYELIKAQL